MGNFLIYPPTVSVKRYDFKIQGEYCTGSENTDKNLIFRNEIPVSLIRYAKKIRVVIDSFEIDGDKTFPSSTELLINVSTYVFNDTKTSYKNKDLYKMWYGPPYKKAFADTGFIDLPDNMILEYTRFPSGTIISDPHLKIYIRVTGGPTSECHPIITGHIEFFEKTFQELSGKTFDVKNRCLRKLEFNESGDCKVFDQSISSYVGSYSSAGQTIIYITVDGEFLKHGSYFYVFGPDEGAYDLLVYAGYNYTKRGQSPNPYWISFTVTSSMSYLHLVTIPDDIDYDQPFSIRLFIRNAKSSARVLGLSYSLFIRN